MLKYIGKGAALVVDQVPARDLTDDEVTQFGEKFLIDSGLYVKNKATLLNKVQIGNDSSFPDVNTTVEKAGE